MKHRHTSAASVRKLVNQKFLGLALAMICACLTGCESTPDEPTRAVPDHNSTYDPNYDIIPIAGIRTERITAASASWKVADPGDSIFNVYRIPRSDAEFHSQVSLKLWTKISDAGSTFVYSGNQYRLDSKNWQYKCWTPFNRDTVTFTQGNGPPEELALALKHPLNDEIQVEYKVNHSDWQKLIPGRDFGLFSTDSIQLPEATTTGPATKHTQLAGVNLLIRGKNFISEGTNTIAFRMSKNGNIVRERTLCLNYTILGFTSYESDSGGQKVDTNRQFFYSYASWNGSDSRTSTIFFGKGNAVKVTEIQVERTYQETFHSKDTSDSTLYLLQKAENCSQLADNAWCVTYTGKNALLHMNLRRDLFGAFTNKSESGRGIIIRGNLIVSDSFPPNNPPFKIEYPFHLSD